MTPEDFIQKSKELVAQYENTRVKKQLGSTVKGMVEGKTWERAIMEPEEVYLVWWSKTLQNAKALLATDRRNGMYYEVTLNGDKQEIYFDAYTKESNTAVDVKGGE